MHQNGNYNMECYIGKELQSGYNDLFADTGLAYIWEDKKIYVNLGLDSDLRLKQHVS